MCTVSIIGDHYSDRWKWVPQYPPVVVPNVNPRPQDYNIVYSGISRAEFDALKREVEEMKELLIAAKRIDEVTGQPDCEMADKVAVLRRVAELVGIDLDDVLAR